MKSNIEIARDASLITVNEVAAKIGIGDRSLILYGNYKAKVDLNVINRDSISKSNLILVTAISPTKSGVGKTVTSIGLALGLNAIGRKAAVALRQPSQGPVFGMKGGAAGGGYAQVLPMEDINLHFTGDFHAITAAHNTLAALVYNYQFVNRGTDKALSKIVWKRVIDVNDRTLRQIQTSLDGKLDGDLYTSGFDITAASEIMAILCLAESIEDLRLRIGKIIVGYTQQNAPFTVNDLGVADAITIILKDALLPNLVQTSENTPAFIHGGPFANIAHGCNSVLATKMAMSVCDYVVTEAGFGSDLGAEKFMNIKCRIGDIYPKLTVIVVTTEALKNHAGLFGTEAKLADLESLKKGLPNLDRHIQIIKDFGQPLLIVLNRFYFDVPEEIAFLRQYCEQQNIAFAVNDTFERGGEGAHEMAEALVKLIQQNRNNKIVFTYESDWSIEQKIEAIATKVYHAKGVEYSKRALHELQRIGNSDIAGLPVCIAKTQYSFTDNAALYGAPEGHTLHVDDIIVNAGAGFVVVVAGAIMRMPALPKEPAAYKMRLIDGQITGLA